jgi:RNA polymerase sigma-54 factor
MNISNTILNTTSQKMLISPQILNSLKMLKLSQSELADIINKELADNPFLKEIRSTNLCINNVEENSFEYNNSYSNKYTKNSVYMNNGNLVDSTSDIIEKCASNNETLYEHLIKQLRYYYNDTSSEYKAGELLISSIDNNGFISRDQLKEVFITLKNNKLTARMICKIQSFDPCGICSRDIKELLLIQLNMLKETGSEIETEIIKKYLQLLAKKKYNVIAKKLQSALGLKTTEDRIKEAHKVIKALEIKPARNFSQVPIQYITPDIILEKITGNENGSNIYNNDGFKIIIKDELLPVIKLNQEYDSYINCGDESFHPCI